MSIRISVQVHVKGHIHTITDIFDRGLMHSQKSKKHDILNQTYNATRKWLDFCMNVWGRTIYQIYCSTTHREFLMHSE